MNPQNIQFLPQRHEAPDASAHAIDREVLTSQVRIARHLLKNPNSFVFVEGSMANLPKVMSPGHYRRCNTPHYNELRCMYPSLWRSIRAARRYFSKFDVRGDLMGDGTGALLRDRAFQSNVVAMGAPAFLYFVGAIRYVIFSDSGTHIDDVTRESKRLDRMFGSFGACFMAAPRSRLHRIMFPARERHVLKSIDRLDGRFVDRKRILVFGGLHDFTKYNGASRRVTVPAEFASELAYGRRTKRELVTSCGELVANAIIRGAAELVAWLREMVNSAI